MRVVRVNYVDNLFRLMQWTFYAVMGSLFLSAVFNNISTAFWFGFQRQLFSFLHFTYLFALTAYFIYRFIYKNHSLKSYMCMKYNIVVPVTMCILLVLQMIYAYLIQPDFGADLAIIVNVAGGDAGHRFIHFCERPNLLFMLFFARMLNRGLFLFGLDNYHILVLMMVGVIFVNITITLVFYVIKSAIGIIEGYIAWIFAIILIAFNPWITVPYSDILSMPFVIGILFLYVKLIEATNERKKNYIAVTIGIVAAIGYLIKPHSVVVLIAVFIIQFLRDIDTFWLRKALIKEKQALPKGEYLSKYLVLFTLIGLIVPMVLFGFFVRTQNFINIDENRAIPFEHYIMMGMSLQEVGVGRYRRGSWYEPDKTFTLSHLTTAEMRAANREMIVERLRNFGFIGYTEFLVTKARWVMGDGTFYWGEYSRLRSEGASDLQLRLRHIFCRHGENYSYIPYFMQGIWLFILFWCFVSVFLKKEVVNNVFNVVICALIGGILLIMLMEARSRYLISYLPLFAIVSSIGFVRALKIFGAIIFQK